MAVTSWGTDGRMYEAAAGNTACTRRCTPMQNSLGYRLLVGALYVGGSLMNRKTRSSLLKFPFTLPLVYRTRPTFLRREHKALCNPVLPHPQKLLSQSRGSTPAQCAPVTWFS